jgi:hypothetical protein
MATGRPLRHPAVPEGLAPVPPMKKWRAITVATLLFVPGFWALLAGLVATSSNSEAGAPNPGAALALGLASIPFVFIVLAFLSEHPRAPTAVLKAMGLALVVGIPVSALATDALTGIVVGVGAGGVVALRPDPAHPYKARAVAVLLAGLATFLLVRFVGSVALLPAPILPLTAIGLADHLSDLD